MSKLLELIQNLNKTTHDSIGFGSIEKTRENNHMILISYVDIRRKYQDEILKYSDAIVVKNFPIDHSLESLEKLNCIIGIEINEKSIADLDLLKRKIVDFVIIGSDEINADILLSETFSKGYSVLPPISDDKGASIEEINFDFLIIKDETISFPLKISGLLKIEEMVLKNSGNIFMYTNSLPIYSDLELLRKAQICGVIVDGNGISKKQIKDLKTDISKLKPIKNELESQNIQLLSNINNNLDFENYDE